VETSLASGREVLQGITRYLREQRGWSVFHEPRSLVESVPSWLKNWDGDGIIARISSPKVADAIVNTGLPVVDVLGMAPEAGLPLVHLDDPAVAQVAARSLLDLRLRHFGFCGIAGANWSDRRALAFDQTVQQYGYECAVFRMHASLHERWSWDQQQDELARWLGALPKPAGVMVCSDQRGEHVIEACRRAGIAVPDEVAVVGVDNDSLLCELCDPPLSSVDTALDRVGYAAAELLDRLMAGESPPKEPILFPPRGMIVRASSDAMSVTDPDIAAALRFIREHACDPIDVDEVVEHVTLSRSTLQRRFRHLLARSVHDEILRRRLLRAQELLCETDLPLGPIAERAGFQHSEYLSAVFKQRLGQTPGQYRLAHSRLPRSTGRLADSE
jgi:LacI family transcriptional regulator